MSLNFSSLSKSNNSNEYQTPFSFFEKLTDIFNFELDPCTVESNPLKTLRFYTKNDDGLLLPWSRNTFVNPPFSRSEITKWASKMIKESNENMDKVYCMLLPARTETCWFQDNIWNGRSMYECIIHFVKGRLSFVSPELNANNNPHILGSMLWFLGPITDEQMFDMNQTIKGISIFRNRNMIKL